VTRGVGGEARLIKGPLASRVVVERRSSGLIR
jgi:hypothetical protein